MSIAVIRESTGQVVTFVRDDLPPGCVAPDGCRFVPEQDLPPGWQREPEPEPQPSVMSLGYGELISEPGKVTFAGQRLVVQDGDVQVTGDDRGIILRSEGQADYILTVAEGAVIPVQVSASPEVDHATRVQRIHAARANHKAAVADLKAKGKNATFDDRLRVIEALLGIPSPAK